MGIASMEIPNLSSVSPLFITVTFVAKESGNSSFTACGAIIGVLPRLSAARVSALMGILSTVLSIYAFIYFIHNISQSIQISHIIDVRYTAAKVRLKIVIERDKEAQDTFHDSHDRNEYQTETNGYFRDLNRQQLI